MTESKKILGAVEMDQIIERMVKDLVARVTIPTDLALIGIRTHGVSLAQRIHKRLALEYEWDLPLGVLDTTMYRDDLSQLDIQPVLRDTDINFDVTGKVIVLIDDVLCTGRTVRCALDCILDMGRPRTILLAALVDRGLRELPIQPDVVGIEIETTRDELVEVFFDESDHEDGVWVRRSDDRP